MAAIWHELSRLVLLHCKRRIHRPNDELHYIELMLLGTSQFRTMRFEKRRSSALVSLLAVTLFLVISTVWPSANAQQNLPNMGEPADSALSPIEEKLLGAQFMRQIRATMPLIRDVQVEEYIQSLGAQLAMASGKTANQAFSFFVINDEQINAFAIPGGYVGINMGLIQAMRLEEQLAGVIAHEVAHVTQRHHARAFALGNSYSMRTAATILAAILIGQASAEAGQAALAAGLAANQQSAINFTRSNEIEADRIGIEILANAQYDPKAMAQSFAILRRKNSLNTSAGQLQYLRTHPLDNNRIAEATDRANAKKPVKLAPQNDFQMIKARLAVITSDSRSQLLSNFKSQHKTNPNAGNTYGLALIHEQANRTDLASFYLDKLEKLTPAHPMAKIIRADTLARQGKLDASQDLLELLMAAYPGRYSIVERLLDLQTRQSKITLAVETVNNYFRATNTPNPRAWRQLANFQQRLGDQAASHESLAYYFAAFNEVGRAESQLKLALGYVTPASQDELRLQASLKAIQGQLPGQ